jgi:hypothetical protein
MEPETQPRASVDFELNETKESVTVTIPSIGETDYVILRGDGPSAEVSVNGERKDSYILFDEAGQTVTLTTDGGGLVKGNGTVLVVSIKGEVGEVYSPVFAADDGRLAGSVKGVREVDEEAIQTTIVSIEYDFSE